MIPTYKPRVSGKEVLPPSKIPALPTAYGNKHTSLATPGYIWITNTGTNSVERTDTTTLAVDSFPTNGLTPSGLAFDGTHLYITCFGSNSIVKMTTAGAIVATASIGNGLHQVIFDGDFLWATSYWNGEVYQIRPSTLAVTDSYTIGHFPLNLTFDGTHVWVACFDFTTYANGTGLVAKFNLDVSLAASYTIGINPYGIAFGGGFIWVAAFQGGDIYKVNPATGVVVATYSTGVTDATVTGFTFFDFAGGILIVTVSKDYSPYNLPGNYNKSHVISISDGSLYQLEPLGIDPRNGSVDGFNFVYTAGYGDGSVTRYPLLSSSPTPSILYHFTSLPLTDSTPLTPIAPAPTYIPDRGTLALTTGVFGNAVYINPNEFGQTLGYLHIQPTSFPLLGDYTFRFRHKATGTSSFSSLLSNGSGGEYVFIRNNLYCLGGTSDFDFVESTITPSTAVFDAISVERKAGILYLYINGTLVATNTAPKVAENIENQPISLDLSTSIVDEFVYFLGTALSAPAASYTVETSPF